LVKGDIFGLFVGLLGWLTFTVNSGWEYEQ
jgi:hypothetical protein